MRVRVLVFGVLKEMLPEEDSLELPEGATAGTVLQHFEGSTQTDSPLWSAIAIAVNREYVGPAHPLAEGDEVALLPPVSGGSPVVALVREPIPTEKIAASLRQGADGAVVVFDGMVRNNTRGRRTLYLIYEAYEEMALAQMRSLAHEARTKFGVRDVALIHRLGQLAIGETSVLIVVASAHRAAAFDACRWLIDTLKKTVPIWKKEHFEDGAVWADGEPFPAEIVKGA